MQKQYSLSGTSGAFFALTLCELLHLRNIMIFACMAHGKGGCSTGGCKNKPRLLSAISHLWAPLFPVAQTQKMGNGKEWLSHTGPLAALLGFLSVGGTGTAWQHRLPCSPLEAATNSQCKHSFFMVSHNSECDTQFFAVPFVYLLIPSLSWVLGRPGLQLAAHRCPP